MKHNHSHLLTIPFFTAILFWLVFMALLVGAGMIGAFFPAQLSRMVYGLGGTAAALISTYLFLRFQQSSLGTAGLRWTQGTLRRFLIGIGLGAVMLAAMLTILYLLTDLRWEQNRIPLSSGLIIGYLALLPLAFMEEVAFRAYPFISFQRRYGMWIAQIVTSIAFALYHFPGGNSLLSVLLGPGIWGLVYGVTAAWSRGIAMPFGIHVALNAGQMMMGMKGEEQALWKISHAITPNSKFNFEFNNVGLGMQLAILIIAIRLTFLYTRKQKQHLANAQGNTTLRG